VIAANFSGEAVTMPESPGEIVLATGPVSSGADVTLGPWEGLVARVP
jgi:hypothetical protein